MVTVNGITAKVEPSTGHEPLKTRVFCSQEDRTRYEWSVLGLVFHSEQTYASTDGASRAMHEWLAGLYGESSPDKKGATISQENLTAIEAMQRQLADAAIYRRPPTKEERESCVWIKQNSLRVMSEIQSYGYSEKASERMRRLFALTCDTILPVDAIYPSTNWLYQTRGVAEELLQVLRELAGTTNVPDNLRVAMGHIQTILSLYGDWILEDEARILGKAVKSDGVSNGTQTL